MPCKVGMVSLGCPKNQVDAEMMLARLEDAGFVIVDDPYDAELVIVNTCGFIEDAKREAIDSILEMAQLKEDGELKALVVTGCLAQRYQQEVLEEIPEIEALIGIGANSDIAKVCEAALEGAAQSSFPPREAMPLEGRRILTTPPYWAYLKIADGCSNCCSYCAIPGIRGPFRSRRMESIVEEAQTLASSGVKELILVAQDTTRYGEDLYGALMLPELLTRLCGVAGIEWIRLLYCYPDRITDELLETIAREPKVLHYLDIPLQHACGKVLKSMKREIDGVQTQKIVDRIRESVPGIALRTTMIVGFPTEGSREFAKLLSFVSKNRFERLGAFTYSEEEGTWGARHYRDTVRPSTKRKRYDALMELQSGISLAWNMGRTGSCERVIIDSFSDGVFIARSQYESPEVDGEILVSSESFYKRFGKEAVPLHFIGKFANVRITGADEYDLSAEFI